MSDDLAAEGDRLHAALIGQPVERAYLTFGQWAYQSWFELSMLLSLRRHTIDVLIEEQTPIREECDALRVQAKTAEADADAMLPYCGHAEFCPCYEEGPDYDEPCDCGWTERLAAHAAAVEARDD